MRVRADSDPLASWSSPQVVFPEGIYHGAALSAAGDGSGGVHLAYKANDERLYYRRYTGGVWSGRQLIEGAADWALQPAITRVGGEVVIFWNRVQSTNTSYAFYSRTLGGPDRLLDSSGGFKGYPAAPEVLPASAPAVPCVYGSTADANSGGSAVTVSVPTPNLAPPPPPPPPPPPAPGGGTLFSDDFNRTALGPSWRVVAGLWRADGRANSDLDGVDQAVVRHLACADCTVRARVVNFAAAAAALDLRVGVSNDRYDVALLANGQLQIRRHNGGATTVLGQAASGLRDLTEWSTLSLAASGSNPVQLVASVNDAVKLSVADGSSSAITAAGSAGISTTRAGIWFDDLVVTGAASPAGPPPPPPPPPPAPGGTLFSDDFNRSLSSGLGHAWHIIAGLWRTDGRANADRDSHDQAAVRHLNCADCTVQARVVQFAATEAALALRQTGSGDRYDVALLANGHLQIRRHDGGATIVLGDAPSGIHDLTEWATISLSARGAGPVQLTASVNGSVRLSVSDASAAAITAAGTAGISTHRAGVWFDDFVVTAGPAR
jgi:hypothetical protein